VAIDGIVGYSLAPLRLVTWLGIAIIAGAVLVTLAWLLFWILSPGSFGSGWISTIVLLMFFGGTNILMLGVVAEYVGRIYSATQNRPLYVVSEIFGLAAEASGGSTHDK
jgi:dolichol-phosphate mannosyltransferase